MTQEAGAGELESGAGRRRVVLTGISSRAWEHPADRGALTALRELRGFDDVLKVVSWAVERAGVAAGVPRRRDPGGRPAVPAGAPAVRRGGGDAGRRANCRSCTSRRPLDQRHVHRHVEAVHRDQLRRRWSCSTTRSCAACSATSSATRSAATRSTARWSMILTNWAVGSPGCRSGSIVLRMIIAGVAGVVAQGGAVRRPGRAARLPGPRRRRYGGDEAGRRRRPVGGGHRRVPGAGRRVRARRATCGTA